MKRIRVPEEFLSAVENALGANNKEWDWSGPGAQDECVRVACEAFAQALSEHPQVPTDEQAQELIESSPYCDLEDWPKHHAWCIEQWQRRCFVQEEPEIPKEIEDLLVEPDVSKWRGDELNEAVFEAYRRGLRKGEQK